MQHSNAEHKDIRDHVKVIQLSRQRSDDRVAQGALAYWAQALGNAVVRHVLLVPLLCQKQASMIQMRKVPCAWHRQSVPSS